MLTTPRAIVLAAAIVWAGILAHAAASRYTVLSVENGFMRVDHLLGTATISVPGKNPAPWIVAYQPHATSTWQTPFASTAWETLKDASIVVLAVGIAVGVVWRYKLAWQAEQRHKAQSAAR